MNLYKLLLATTGVLVVPISATRGQTATAAPTCGQIYGQESVTQSGNQILVNGQPFIAHGVDLGQPGTSQAIADPTGVANQLTSEFPGLNMVRISVGNSYSTASAAALAPFILALNAKGVVVSIGNYSLTNTVATGDALTQEIAWYTSLASTFKGDNLVWFTTDNEPTDSATFGGATAAEQQAVYNAIRGTGSNAMIGLENTQWAGGSSASVNPSDYAGMTNVFDDVHYYNWLSGYSTDVGINAASLQGEVSASRAAYGNIPVIIGEFGNSTTGDAIDPGGDATISAVTQSGYGWTAWAVNPGGNGDILTNGNGSLTSYGQQVASAIGNSALCGQTNDQLLADVEKNITPDAGSGGATEPSSTAPAVTPEPSPALTQGTGSVPNCQGVGVAGSVTPGSGAFSVGSNTYSIDAGDGNVASINGAPINSGSYQTAQLMQSGGIVYGQDENTLQWFQLMGSGGGTWWQPLTGLPSAGQGATGTTRWDTAQASSPGQTSCGTTQNASGTQNPSSGILPDLLQICGNPATTSNPTNEALCLQAFQTQSLIEQTQSRMQPTPAGAPQ